MQNQNTQPNNAQTVQAPTTPDVAGFIKAAQAKGVSNDDIYNNLKNLGYVDSGGKITTAKQSSQSDKTTDDANAKKAAQDADIASVKSYGSNVMKDMNDSGANMINDVETPIDFNNPSDLSLGNVAHNTGQVLKKGVDTAYDAMTGVFAPLTEAIKGFISNVSNDPGLQSVATNPHVSKLLDAVNSVVSKVNDAATAHPETAKTVQLILAGLLPDDPDGDVLGSIKKNAGDIVDTGKEIAGTVGDVIQKGLDLTKDVPSDIADSASKLKGKIAPTEDIDTTVNKVLQGKPTDIESGKSALPSLDTSKIKTYEDLTKASNSKIGELSDKQDELLSQDKTPRKIQQLALEERVGGRTIAHNYVNDAVNHLEEVYSKTNDPVNLEKIQNLKAKLDPIKGDGITVKEANDLAREYGSKFKSKAFGKNGDPLTSVNSQAYENTRMGVKNTVRNLLPTEESKALDGKMTDLYNVRDLSSDMEEKVNSLEAKLKSKNILQKLGGLIGRGLKFSGVSDLVKQLVGLENTPGASSMNPVEIQAMLSKNLSRITDALGQDDTGFVKSIKDILNHPK